MNNILPLHAILHFPPKSLLLPCSLPDANAPGTAGSEIIHRVERSLFFLICIMFDPMSELTGVMPPDEGGAPTGGSAMPPPRRSSTGGGGAGRFAQDIHSVTIHARQRTFYVDLKESGNGKFFKISEKSRGGQKTTIMFDVEDLPKIIAALQEMQTKL